jgi:hypothetical protein
MRVRITLRVPPHKVEELLDQIWRIAKGRGTLEITNLIDEYREDIYIERTDRKESSHGSRTKDRRTKGR